MGRRKLLTRSASLGVVVAIPLSLYISLTTFLQMSLSLWLTFHNLLVVMSLFLAMLIGYNNRASQASIGLMLLSVGVFFMVIMCSYLGTYFVTTAFFAEKMAWIPFFHRDYTYHGFRSVAEYLNHKSNFRDLFELQVFSFLVGSIMYFVSGSLGYAMKVLFERHIQTRTRRARDYLE